MGWYPRVLPPLAYRQMSHQGDAVPTAAKVLADFITLVLITFAVGTAFGVMLDRVVMR